MHQGEFSNAGATMHRILAASAILGIACASVRQAALPTMEDRAKAGSLLCRFSAPVHPRSLELRLPGGGPVFAQTGYGASSWPQVDADLVWRGSAWLEVVVAGDGLLVWADVEATEREVLYAAKRIALGQVGFMALDADLRVVGGERDRVVVRPSSHAFTVFQPVGSVDQQVSCDALSLIRPAGAPDGGDARLASLGLEPIRRAWIRVPDALPLRASPAGEILGHVQPGLEAQDVEVLEEREGWLRVVLGDHYTGTVWLGWLAASREDPGLAYGVGGLGARRTGPRPEPRWQACSDRQPLFAQPAGTNPTQVGWILQGTVFAVQRAEEQAATIPESLVSIRLRETWLHSADTTLLLPQVAVGCQEF